MEVLLFVAIEGLLSTFFFNREVTLRRRFFVNRDRDRRERLNPFGAITERMTVFYSQEQIERLVRQSGIPIPLTVEGLVAIQFGFVFFVLMVLWVLPESLVLKVFLTLLLSPGAYSLPILMLNFLKRDRQTSFILDFRDFKRMMILGLEAGLETHEATTLALKSARGVFREIVEPIYYRIGFTDTLISVFMSIYEDVGLDEVRAFSTVLAQAERNGTPIVKALQGSLEREWKDKENNMERVYQVKQNIATLLVIFVQFGPVIMSLFVLLGGFIFSEMHKF